MSQGYESKNVGICGDLGRKFDHDRTLFSRSLDSCFFIRGNYPKMAFVGASRR